MERFCEIQKEGEFQTFSLADADAEDDDQRLLEQFLETYWML